MTTHSSRFGRSRPQGGGYELFVWYAIRLSGLALFVLALAHFSILHFLYDPAEQDTEFITNMRWSSIFWRATDWLMLMMVILHSTYGVRIVVRDYTRGGVRTFLTMSLYLLAIVLFGLGTIVVMTLPRPIMS
jgi:succinate dehydrogenase / fumarate reductase membrane anchor subunit